MNNVYTETYVSKITSTNPDAWVEAFHAWRDAQSFEGTFTIQKCENFPETAVLQEVAA